MIMWQMARGGRGQAVGTASNQTRREAIHIHANQNVDRMAVDDLQDDNHVYSFKTEAMKFMQIKN